MWQIKASVFFLGNSNISFPSWQFLLIHKCFILKTLVDGVGELIAILKRRWSNAKGRFNQNELNYDHDLYIKTWFKSKEILNKGSHPSWNERFFVKSLHKMVTPPPHSEAILELFKMKSCPKMKRNAKICKKIVLFTKIISFFGCAQNNFFPKWMPWWLLA